MFITKAKKYRQQDDGTILAYSYYRLTKSFRDSSGKIRKRNVLCLGELDGYSKGEREELADMLTEMIENGQHIITDNPKLRQAALDFYLKYRKSDYARENDPVLREEALRREREQRKDLITVHIDSLTQREARTIGPEALCHSTLKMLQIGKFLYAKGWSRDQVTLAMMQIIARSIYPYSELKTVRYLKENTALAELFKFSKVKITKDALYRSALRLWDVHRELEDWLHQRVCNMFQLEEKILLFDITNAYFEGRMENSDLCRFGRSKEKRNDCKIVVLAAVVNTEGLLVRTAIYEGNRQDRTTLEEVIGSISKETSPDAKKIVVMDAGFYTKDNIKWLTDHHFDYITVLPLPVTRSCTIKTVRSRKYGFKWVQSQSTAWIARHCLWTAMPRPQRSVPCTTGHANATKRDLRLSGQVYSRRAEQRKETPSTSVSANWTRNTAPSEKASPSTSPTREKARMRRWYPSRGRKTASRLTPLRSSMENMS